MLTPEERALITDLKDRLIELYVERDEAAKTGDRDRVRDLQSEIEDVAAHRGRGRSVSGYPPLGNPRIGLNHDPLGPLCPISRSALPSERPRPRFPRARRTDEPPRGGVL